MSKPIIIDKKIDGFKKKIFVSGDKSLSIRWALLASQATGRSRAFNLLKSEDVFNTLKSLKKLGVKVTTNKNYTEIVGNGINSFNYKKNIILDAGNSGTLGRLILALLIKSPNKVKVTGDESLKKRLIVLIIPQQIQIKLLKKGYRNDALAFDTRIKEICNKIDLYCLSLTEEIGKKFEYKTHFLLDGHLLPEVNKYYGTLAADKIHNLLK